MKWKNEKAIVFGGGGFLGQNIIRNLIDLDCGDIKSFGRGSQPGLQRLGVVALRGDIRDAEAVKTACSDSTIIFHTAAKAGFWGPYEEYYDINTLGTANVINAARANNISRLIYTSSPSVAYKGSENIENGNETLSFPGKYLAFYPATKASAEKMVMAAAADGPGTVSLRPHLIWGAGDPHLLPRIVKKAAARKLMIIGDGANMVDLTHVGNAAIAHIKAAEALTDRRDIVNGKVYFVSDGTPVRLWDWLNALFARCGIPAVKRSISYGAAFRIGSLMETAYRLLRLKGEPPMTRFLAGQLSHSHYFDISAAGRDIGYSPSVDMESATSATADYLSSILIQK
ncbi:MAG: hypothetical protein A2020_11225 [Lentisphaerae bacterium GWF2_45_14]|nr:MAG: hypothetical protein A2020_11225 [Lentisphaerae bacterium GWF2_45_14]